MTAIESPPCMGARLSARTAAARPFYPWRCPVSKRPWVISSDRRPGNNHFECFLGIPSVSLLESARMHALFRVILLQFPPLLERFFKPV